MENYLLCGELSPSQGPLREEGEDDSDVSSEREASGRVVAYKGRRRGTVNFCGIWRHNKAAKDLVANGVSCGQAVK